MEQVAKRNHPLTEAQREILRTARANRGVIRSVQAGVILHAHREQPCPRADARGCCEYAAGDGGDALTRLASRGLARRVGRGIWEVVG
jgi:hypothetical protein